MCIRDSVHTAPGHGIDDFNVIGTEGVDYGITIRMIDDKPEDASTTSQFLDPRSVPSGTDPELIDRVDGFIGYQEWGTNGQAYWDASDVDWIRVDLVNGIQYEFKALGASSLPSNGLNNSYLQQLSDPSLILLDENGEKISKSIGNGISVEDWLDFSPRESLELFMFQNPTRAKRLYFDVIPKMMDEYHQSLNSYENQSHAQKLQNPVWHIHSGPPPRSDMLISFSMLLNLVVASGSEDETTLWGFIDRYAPNIEQDLSLIHI